MATAKTNRALQAERMAQELEARKDAYQAELEAFLAANARILRDPAVWGQYHEAVHTAELLGFTVTQTGGKHEVHPC